MQRISVVIAAYRAAAFIEKAVASALVQRGVAVEVIVVDDASDDDTAEVLTRLCQKDPRIRLLSNPRNTGPAGARNLGLDHAAGDWIAVLDADDRFAPDRLACMVDKALKFDADIVIDDFISVDAEGNELNTPLLSEIRGAGIIDLESWVSLNLFKPSEISFGYAKPLVSRAFLDKKSLRYNEGLRNGEDFYFILNAIDRGAQVYFSEIAGYHYTRRDGSISRRAQDDHMKALLAADDSFVARPTVKNRAELRRLMAWRRRNLTSLIATEQVMSHLKAKRLAAAAAQLLRQPGATGRVLHHLRQALWKRLAR